MSYSCKHICENIIVIKHSNIEHSFFIKFSIIDEDICHFQHEKNISDIIGSKSEYFIQLEGIRCPVLKCTVQIYANQINTKYIVVPYMSQTIVLNEAILGSIDSKEIYVLIGHYNPSLEDMNTLYMKEFQNNIHLCNRCIYICNIIDSDMRSNNFVHGDLKMSNILSKINNPQLIKFIDLEGGYEILEEKTLVNEENTEMIHAYLSKEGYFCKEYLFLFDIFVFAFSIIHTGKNILDIHELLLRSVINDIVNPAFLDLVIIITILRHHMHSVLKNTYVFFGKSFYTKRSDGALNCTYKSIQLLFNTDTSINSMFTIPLLKERFILIKEMVIETEKNHKLHI